MISLLISHLFFFLSDPTQTPSKDDSFAIERYTKDENFTMAHLRCANFDGSLLRVAKLKNTRILSSSTENDINWVGIRFPNSSFRWYNNETGALQIIDCLTGLNPNLERCVFLECCNKITGVCSVQCFDRTCNACGNSSFVIYICTKGNVSKRYYCSTYTFTMTVWYFAHDLFGLLPNDNI